MKVLLSTDIGSDVDDALTLDVMLNHPGINLRGVYTVNGKVDARAYIAKRMIDLSGKEIPVCKGESKPLGAVVSPYTFFEDYLVDDCFLDKKRMEREGGYDTFYLPLKMVGIVENGTAHLRKQLLEDKHVIFSIAPLTNIAKVIDNAGVRDNVERLYIMGGNLEGVMEHNFRFDYLAAQKILESDIPITIIPSDVCNKYRMPASFKSQFKGDLGKYVRKMFLAFLGAKTVGKFIETCIGGGDLRSHIKNNVTVSLGRGASGDELIRVGNFKDIFFANFDESTAYFETEEFWRDFDKMISYLRDPKYGFRQGREVAEVLTALVPENVSVSDAYVPYCFLHSENLVTEKMNLTCDLEGRTIVLPGEKHEIVREIDYKDFERFLKENLR